jgi:hypothetical protein
MRKKKQQQKPKLQVAKKLSVKAQKVRELGSDELARIAGGLALCDSRTHG